MDKDYRDCLIKTIAFLEDTSGNLLAEILNISSIEEMPLLRDSFEEGEIFEFNIEMFENSNDFNIIKLVSLYKNIENQRLILVALNDIKDQEIDAHYVNLENDFSEDTDEDDLDLLNNLNISLN